MRRHRVWRWMSVNLLGLKYIKPTAGCLRDYAAPGDREVPDLGTLPRFGAWDRHNPAVGIMAASATSAWRRPAKRSRAAFAPCTAPGSLPAFAATSPPAASRASTSWRPYKAPWWATRSSPQPRPEGRDT